MVAKTLKSDCLTLLRSKKKQSSALLDGFDFPPQRETPLKV